MVISRMNLLQAIGSIVSLVLYLLLPILSVSVLVPIGFTGETCMQLGFLFVIPLILLGLTLIVSLLPIGPYNSIAGIVTAIGLLVVGSLSKSVAAAEVDQLLQITGINQITGIGKEVSNFSSSLGLNLNVGNYASMALKMSYGLTIPILIMLITAVLGIVITVLFTARANSSHNTVARGRYQDAGIAGGPRSTTGTGVSSNRSRYQGAGVAGGPVRSSRPTTGTRTSSHRSRSANYHR